MVESSGDRARADKISAPPTWYRGTFQPFLDDIERLGQVVQISARGITMLQAAPKLMAAVIRLDGDETDGQNNRVEMARQEAELATREVTTDFPVLHGWAVIAMWAQLEALIRTLMATWLKRRRSHWDSAPFERLRVKLGDYERIPHSLRHLYVAELVERELGAGTRNGIQRFEAILDVIGLSGPVPKNICDALYELGKTRNLIAHSASRIDRRFKADCPWVRGKIGSTLYVSSAMFSTYLSAVSLYVTLLICRAGTQMGIDMKENLESVEQGAKALPNQRVDGSGKSKRSKKS